MGPHAEQSARFQVTLISAGQHAKEFLIEDGYLDEVSQAKRESALRQQKEASVEEIRINSAYACVTPDDPPAFLCVGELDKKFRVSQMKRLAAQCEKVGLEHPFIIQPGMPHMYSPNPDVIGEIYRFFDRHLKVSNRERRTAGQFRYRWQRQDLRLGRCAYQTRFGRRFSERHFGSGGHSLRLGVEDRIGLHGREGTHAQNREDWAALLVFADLQFFDKRTDRRFDHWIYPEAEPPLGWKATGIVPAK